MFVKLLINIHNIDNNYIKVKSKSSSVILHQLHTCRISPALLRQSVYGSLKFGAYYSLKRLLPYETVYTNIVCAVIAGNLLIHILSFLHIFIYMYHLLNFPRRKTMLEQIK